MKSRKLGTRITSKIVFTEVCIFVRLAKVFLNFKVWYDRWRNIMEESSETTGYFCPFLNSLEREEWTSKKIKAS